MESDGGPGAAAVLTGRAETVGRRLRPGRERPKVAGRPRPRPGVAVTNLPGQTPADFAAANLVRLLVVGTIMGFTCGLVPFQSAMRRGRPGLGTAALGVCTLSGMMCGCFLSVPASWLMRLLIVGLPDMSHIGPDPTFGWSGPNPLLLKSDLPDDTPRPARRRPAGSGEVIDLVKADEPPAFNPYAGGRTSAFGPPGGPRG